MNEKPMIMAVDDSRDILFAIAAICEVAGWNHLLALDGMQAMTLMEEKRPDLVLVDFHMPGLDGISTVREIRLKDPLVPILVLTVEDSQQTANRFFEAGADDYALKPIRTPDLISRIRIHLRMRQSEQKGLKETGMSVSEKEKRLVTPDAELPKGISERTMAHVLKQLSLCHEPVTIQSLSQAAGLAYQTVHRYLLFLQEKGRLEVHVHYGKQGRPLQAYRMKSPETKDKPKT